MSTCSVKNLKEASEQDQIDFLKSFDAIFCDIDGVIWSGTSKIDGAVEGITSLKSIGKKVYYLTNNTTLPLKALVDRLQDFGVRQTDVVRPDLALIWYLKSINFDKTLYVVATNSLVQLLRSSGFKVYDEPINRIEETIYGVADALKLVNPDVGAVIVDIDINVSYIKLQRCIQYIQQNDALFLVGGYDDIMPFKNTFLIGCKYFASIIEDISGKKPTIISKPYEIFHQIVKNHIPNLDDSRTLFIGDTIATDMVYATKFGYKKLLPLTGCTSSEDLRNWKFDENVKPDYFVDNIKTLHDIIENLKSHELL